MKLKIEKKPLTTLRHKNPGDWADFLDAMKVCKVGESFVVPACPSNYRLAISIAQSWLGAHFRAVSEGSGFRIGRVS